MKRNRIAVIITSAFLLIGAGTAAVTSGDDVDVTDRADSGTDGAYRELVRHVKAADPALLENLSNEDYVLGVRGTIPAKKSGEESYRWFRSLDSLRADVLDRDLLKAYMYPDGPVVGYGANADSYFSVALYSEEYKITADDVDRIASIISDAAAEKGIRDVPVVFEKSEPLRYDEPFKSDEKRRRETGQVYQRTEPVCRTPSQADESAASAEAGGFPGVKNASGYSSRYRPVAGGVLHGIAGYQVYSEGTTGFAAENATMNTTGYVVSGHVAFWQTGLTSYQPDLSYINATGTVSVQGVNTDAAFVPYSDVVGKIHIGNGTLVNVNGTYDGGMPGMTLHRSGKTSGCVSGTYLTSSTNMTFDGHLLNHVESMSGNSLHGDSGGPVYYIWNGKYKIVGIMSMNGTVSGQPATFYIPYFEINSKLGVTALTA